MHIKGYLLIASAALLWGLIGPISKLALAEGVLPLEIAFWRGMLAWLFFGAQALWAREIILHRRDIIPLLFFAVTGVSMFYGFYQLAVKHGGAALAAVLLYTAPVWVAVMARIFLNEPLTRAKLAAVGLSILGVACISLSSGGVEGGLNLPAIFFGLGSGFCYSLYYIFGKKFSAAYSAPNLFFYLLPAGSLFLAPFVPFSPKSATAWGAMLGLALLCTYMAYHCYYAGLRYLQASKASIVATLEPVAAAAIAFVWWGETLSPMAGIGAVAILTGVILTIREKPGEE